MNLTIISQDKKSVWDFSQCYIYIPYDKIHDIYIKPYSASNGVSIATYKDPKRTEEVLNEIINIFIKSELFFTPKYNRKPETIEYSKIFFEELTKKNHIITDNALTFTSIGNYTLAYQLPEDGENNLIFTEVTSDKPII